MLILYKHMFFYQKNKMLQLKIWGPHGPLLGKVGGPMGPHRPQRRAGGASESARVRAARGGPHQKEIFINNIIL